MAITLFKRSLEKKPSKLLQVEEIETYRKKIETREHLCLATSINRTM